jgi:methyl-accepting chemotaxis protein/methyl-accepting chemotaxis protein-1 (serine sensor receptor)
MEGTEQHRFTVGKKLFGVFAAMSALVLGLVCAGTAYYRQCTGLLDICARKLYAGTQIELATTEMQGAQRGLMLSYAMNDPHAAAQYTDLYAASSRKIDASLQDLRPLLNTDTERDATERIAKNRTVWEPRFRQLAQLCEAGDIQGAYKLRNENKLISAEMHAGATALVSEQKTAGEAVQAESNRMVSRTAALALLLSLALGASGGAVVRTTTRQLRRTIADLHDGADRVAAAAARIAHSGREVALGATEQAGSLEQTAAFSRDMAARTVRNAEDSQQAAELVTGLNRLVADAEGTLGGMVVSMEEITESSGRISRIMRVVDEIAFQTRLLALNAAVEAARAGEAGAGFAVVADEVRNLAQRSAQAARDTAGLVEQSIEKSRAGAGKLSDVADSVRAIAGSANRVKGLVDEVDVSSRDEARGIEQIAKAVVHMDDVIRRTVLHANESAEATEQLQCQSDCLRAVVGRLESLAGKASPAGKASLEGRVPAGRRHAY